MILASMSFDFSSNTIRFNRIKLKYWNAFKKKK